MLHISEPTKDRGRWQNVSLVVAELSCVLTKNKITGLYLPNLLFLALVKHHFNIHPHWEKSLTSSLMTKESLECVVFCLGEFVFKMNCLAFTGKSGKVLLLFCEGENVVKPLRLNGFFPTCCSCCLSRSRDTS